MKLADYNRLRKLMMLTTSDNDNEALGSLRKANAVLAENGYTWNSAFDRLVRVETMIEAFEEPAPSRPSLRSVQVTDPAEKSRRDWLDGLVSEAEAKARGTTADFVASLRSQLDAKGWLSGKQIDRLKEIVER